MVGPLEHSNAIFDVATSETYLHQRESWQP